MQRIKDEEGFCDDELESIIWFLWHQRQEAFSRITEWERLLQSMDLCPGSVEYSIKVGSYCVVANSL